MPSTSPQAPSDYTQASLLAALGAFGESSRPAMRLTPPTIACDEPPPAAVPTRIAGVRLLRLLERGGHGAVYLGHHETLDVEVAVKVLPADRADPDLFVREARVIAKIRHPNVVAVMDAGREGAWCYLVMELVRGGDVLRLVRRDGPLPWRRALRLAADVAEGLSAVHRLGYIHGDIKPANLVVDESGTVKIADLGIARPRGTVLRSAPGTPAYLAPEIVAGAPADPTADVYALGISMHYVLSGVEPFLGEDAAATLTQHRDAPVPDLCTALPELPRPVADLVRRMLAKEPSARPRDGAEAVAEIRRALARSGDGRSSARRRVARRAAPALAAGVLAALALLLGSGHVVRGIVTAGAAPNGLAPAAPAPAPAKPRWSTPARSVFVIARGLPLAVEEAVDTRLRAGGLPLIERPDVDLLVREQSLAVDGRVDPASAVELGRMLGGHLALFARDQDGHVRLAVVVVETGERVGSALVDEAAAADAAAKLVDAAAAALPARGTLTGEGALRVDLGRRNGLHPGDRLRVRGGDAASPGAAVAVATVGAVSDDAADITVDGPRPSSPALVERVAADRAR